MVQEYPFIFSNERKYRISRHLVFWVFWWLFMSLLYVFVPSSTRQSYLHRVPNSLADGLIYLSCHMFLSYSLMYFVIPRYVVRTKYTLAAFWALFFILLTGAISAVVTLYVLTPVKEFILQFQCFGISFYTF